MLYFSRWKVALIALICLGMGYIALPNLLSEAHQQRFARWLPNTQLQLGLDLRGGAHLLIEVDTEEYLKGAYADLADSMRKLLRQEKLGYRKLQAQATSLEFELRDAEEETALYQKIRRFSRDLDITKLEGNIFNIAYTKEYLEQLDSSLVNQSIEIIRRRIDETGTKEPTLQRQGTRRILLQVPGMENPDQLKHLLGKTAKLTFHLLDPQATTGSFTKSSVMILPGLASRADGEVYNYAVKRQVLLSGEMLIDAKTSFQEGRPVVSFTFNNEGARRFGAITKAHTGEPFAIVLDNTVISAPVINEPILGGAGIIQGGFTVAQANELSLLLRAGALPAPLTVIEERVVGPSLGSDSIVAGKNAAIVGTLLVIVFMIASYHIFGIFATIALLVNLLLLIAMLALVGATLTMPGIAAIVLTLGMAVDANVLIFERIREEARSGISIHAACTRGFEHAYRAILDSNITTLIVAFLLYALGTGPVKGFAVALSLGIMTSMFTAITLTKLLIAWWLKSGKQKKFML
jgi:preprotein translocase subunit SecD